MIRSLSTGISGIQQFQQKMDVISNNIANSNTTGFKAGRVNFADSFSQTLRSSTSADGTSSGTSAIQIGSGVTTAAINNQYTQGGLAHTGVPTDLAISGEGFFMVRDPVTGATFATRSGEFKLDANNYLITTTGLRVQGFTDSGLSNRGDVQVDALDRPADVDPDARYESFSIDKLGRVIVQLDSGEAYARGQILLQRFSDPQALNKEGLSLYSGIGNAGPLGGAGAPTAQPAGTNGLGRLEAGALELSNVELANEFSGMITTQRAFQASARIITTSDEMLQELVNLKR